MKKRNNTILALALALSLCAGALTGCGQTKVQSGREEKTVNANVVIEEKENGVLRLKVNPEIAITYDADGRVVSVDGRNEDAKALLKDYIDFEGKDCLAVVNELVAKIGDAGYFVEEVEGKARTITIEIENGSIVPKATFLEEIIEGIQKQIRENNWHNPITAEEATIYEITDYGTAVDSKADYGTMNHVETNYAATVTTPAANAGQTEATTVKETQATAPAVYGRTDYGATDYDAVTDYGVTDYNDTDYGPNNDGVTDYDDTDYGPNNDGVTDYDVTDYGNTNYDAATDYGVRDYNKMTDYGATDYQEATDYGNTDYNGSDYDKD